MPSEQNRQRPQEQEAIRTTIVGGRPPGCGKAVGGVPRGIEVLTKKAAVDPEFRSLLLTQRGQAARSIGLDLSPAESMMLSAVPAAQLRSIIAATMVPQAHMPAFLGKVAAVMLAALGIVQCGCDDNKGQPAGIRPEDQTKDNPAAANRPADPADNQPITVAGAVIVKPLTRPATQPIQPVSPVAGIMVARPPEPVEVAGVRADRPENVTVLGIMPDVPQRPATQPATAPAQPPQELTVFGMMIDRPQDTAIRGLRADTPRVAPATQPTTQPAAESLAPESLTVYGMITDRPAVIKGLRIDRPAPATTAPTTNPTTKPAAQSPQPQPPMIIAGIMSAPPPTTKPSSQPGAQTDEPRVPDFPIAIDGIRPDRPKPNTP